MHIDMHACMHACMHTIMRPYASPRNELFFTWSHAYMIGMAAYLVGSRPVQCSLGWVAEDSAWILGHDLVQVLLPLGCNCCTRLGLALKIQLVHVCLLLASPDSIASLDIMELVEICESPGTIWLVA
mmetsp:Transcript_15732/g.46488  ORF Transcript_15732/g.46488 Transcript_15732/m.46488 type:complete len:127 (+) Transcript_15732:3095-3475(+)